MNRCLACGSDDLMEFPNLFRCQRCGANNSLDGSSVEYGEEAEENTKRYDDYYDNHR